MNKLVAVVDYGMGNLHSVAKSAEQAVRESGVNARVVITQQPEELRNAERIILPGQGAMADCMAELTRSGLKEAVIAAAATKPFLGICVGEQMLLEWSAEGSHHHVDSNDTDNAAQVSTEQGTPSLGLIPGKVVRFADHLKDSQARVLKVPHMGWNQIQPVNNSSATHPMWSGIEQGEYFYFAHSYYAEPENPNHIAATTEYGIKFCCAVAKDNLFAVQFHPEKSHLSGLKLLRNFMTWQPV
jgi:imidazole glycerol-phosphate synthase subunit HisH